MNHDDMTEEEIEAYLDTLDFTCALCGEDSRGEAGIGDKFYCHRDDRSCYMTASHSDSTLDDFLMKLEDDGWAVTFVDERDRP